MVKVSTKVSVIGLMRFLVDTPPPAAVVRWPDHGLL
jgi:hypothetical protein